MRRLYLLLALLLPAAPASHAQEIFGTVSNERGEPLPGVNVYVLGTVLGAATTLDGTYRIARVPSGNQTLVASAVGYRQERKAVSVPEIGTVRMDFVLRETAIQSEEIVVTASRREQFAGKVAASVSVLSPQDIEARNAVSLDEALRYVPGVQMSGNQVNVRGSSGFSYNTGSRVLLLLDGMPMLRADADGISFDAVPMNQVQRIEVLKGPGSALYGGGALGGVINVITKDFPEVPETFVEGFAGAYQPVRYDTWRSQWNGADELRPLGGLTVAHARRLSPSAGMWVNVSYRKDEGHLRLGKRENLQAYTKLGWRPRPDGRLNVLLGLNRRKSDTFLFWNGARDALNPGRIEFGRDDPGRGSDDYLTTELSLLPSYTQVLGPTLSATAKARVFGVLIQPLDEDLKPKPLNSGTTGFRYGGEVQINYSPAESRFVTGGFTADANATRSSYFEGDESLSQPEGAAFLQWEESIGDRLDLIAGARYDVYRIRQGVVEDKL
ncbi:MAG: TonB-dependent receptor, partial [Rhodothermales bacterium]